MNPNHLMNIWHDVNFALLARFVLKLTPSLLCMFSHSHHVVIYEMILSQFHRFSKCDILNHYFVTLSFQKHPFFRKFDKLSNLQYILSILILFKPLYILLLLAKCLSLKAAMAMVLSMALGVTERRNSPFYRLFFNKPFSTGKICSIINNL